MTQRQVLRYTFLHGSRGNKDLAWQLRLGIEVGGSCSRNAFRYRDAKEISFCYFRNTKLCGKQEKTQVNSIYIAGIMFVRQVKGVSK